MGYYSDVAIVLTKSGVATLNESLEDTCIPKCTLEETKRLLENADKHFTDHTSGSENWYWQDIKWYTCDPGFFPEVSFVMDILNRMDSDEYRFVRIGEDNDDTEILGFYWDDPFDLTLHRHISLAG